ncbi:MAG: BamA/TamA family outer membrane protein [bacterium]|nr:BamA/TamA family outer membrane protein [bacterium]
MILLFSKNSLTVSRKFFLLIFLVGLAATSVYSQDNPTFPSTPMKTITLDFENKNRGAFEYKRVIKPKLGLALSGGGLKGFAHIGVIEVLEEEGIPPDHIACSSIGAIVGGLYAVGYTPEELQRFALETDWRRIFLDSPERSSQFLQQKTDQNKHLLVLRFDGIEPYIPQAISQGQRILSTMNSLILRASFNPHSSFDQFRVPIRIVATNRNNGEETVFKEGDLAQVILASISVPLLLYPVQIGDEFFWDAGLKNNVPTNVARDMGSDVVVAVNTTAGLRKEDRMEYPWQITDQITTIMQMARNEELLNLADIVIDPNLKDRDSYEFDSIEEFIEMGRIETRKMLPLIREKLNEIGEDDNNSYYVTPDKIRISGLRNLDQDFAQELISITRRMTLTEKDIKKDLETLFETGYFENVKADIIKSGDEMILEFQVIENPVVNNIVITGNTVFTEQEIIKMSFPGQFDVFNSHYALEFIQSIYDNYIEEGVSLVQLKTFKIDTSSNTLFIEIDEGRIHRVDITGNELTRLHVIEREFTLKKGEIFNFYKAQRGITNLYGSGLFEKVQPIIEFKEEKLIVKIIIKEQKPEMMRLGARYDNDTETKVNLELVDDNFIGTGMKSLIQGSFGQRFAGFKYRFRADRIFQSYLTFDGNIHFSSDLNFMTDHRQDFIRRGDFRDTRIGATISIGAQLGRLGNVSTVLNMENVKIEAYPYEDLDNEYSEQFYDIVNEEVELRTIRIQSVVDTRDSDPFPTIGTFSTVYYETAASILGGKFSYVKFYSSFGFVFTVRQRHTFEPGFVFGSADESLPYSQRFRWGGMKTFFGKGMDTLHGRVIFATNIGYRYKLPLRNMFDTYFKLRYDIVNIAENSEDFKLKEFMTGIGGSITVSLPIGPLEIGYGSVMGELDRVYFSLGHDF